MHYLQHTLGQDAGLATTGAAPRRTDKDGFASILEADRPIQLVSVFGHVFTSLLRTGFGSMAPSVNFAFVSSVSLFRNCFRSPHSRHTPSDQRPEGVGSIHQWTHAGVVMRVSL